VPADVVRDAAIAVLLRVFEQGAFLDRVLDGAIARTKLSARGRRFLTQLVYGTVRHNLLCDFVIESMLRQPIDKLPKPILTILRMGVFQSLFCDQVTHPAMVHTSVDLAKKWGHAGTARLVNAVLKRAPQSLQDVRFPDPERDPARHLSVRYSMPLWLVQRWAETYGRDVARTLCETSNTEAPTTVRVNTLRTTSEKLARLLAKTGFAVEKRTCVPEELTCAGVAPTARAKAFQAGYYVLQDPASMLAAHLLEPQAGERILDMCSAPGGKAGHIAQLTHDDARLVAMDIHARKLRRVRQNAERMNLRSLSLLCGDGASAPFPKCFDRVLVDAPCTGCGTLRRHPDLKWRLQPGDAERLATLQLALLRSAVEVCKNGGLVVYSVCTFSPDETVHVAEAIHADGKTEFDDGPEWIGKWRIERGRYQILPEKGGPDGFFLMRLRTVS